MKKLAIAALIILVLAGAGAFAAWQAFSRGFGGFDDWVVRKVADIAELYLVPDIEFDAFDYEGRAVTLEGVSLVAPDGTSVLTAASLKVTLASIPVPGSGITIERVEVSRADLRLIRSAAPDGSFEFRGLLPLVEEDKVENQEQVEEDMRLNNAFAIRLIALDDCSITYEPGGDEPPMSIRGIVAELDVQPREDSAQAAGGLGTYDLKLNIDRSPLFSIAMRGDANLDDIELRLAELSLTADLEQDEAVGVLPGRLQQFVQDHDVHGHIELDASGTILGASPLDSTLDTNLTLEDINVSAGEYRFPIDTGTIRMSLADRVASFPTLTLRSCDGTISADGARVTLSESSSAELSWSIEGFRMRELLRTHTGGEDAAPKVAGVVTSTGSATASLADLPASISGSGEINVREGRLVNLPLNRELAVVMGVLDLIAKREVKLKDRADILFNLTADAVDVTKLVFETSILAARGKGDLFYDGRLDLLLNAGPLEKIQEKTGPIGDIIGLVSDQLVKYDVEGTVGEPKVSVRPLGIGG